MPRSLRFARALAGRYGRARSGLPPARRVFARAAAVARLVRRRMELHARLELALGAPARAARPGSRLRTAPRMTRPPCGGPLTRGPGPVDRLAARGKRVEWLSVGPAARSSSPGAAPPSPPKPVVGIPTVRPVARVLRRPAPLTERAEASAVTSTSWRVTASKPATGLSPAEVERLADQVMHSIDRRLTAFRERRGRS